MSSTVQDLVGAVAEPQGRWRLMAIGALIGDLSPEAIARYAGVTEFAVSAELDAARHHGHVVDQHIVDKTWRTTIVQHLDGRTRSAVRDAIGRRLLTVEPSQLPQVIGHARAAGRALGASAIVSMADHAGRLCSNTFDYAAAVQHLSLAVELTSDEDPLLGDRLMQLGRSLDGDGDIDAARAAFMRAARLATVVGDAHLAASAAVAYALPSDWFGGDQRALELLRSAEQMPLSDPDRVMVTAALGLIDMRVPVVHDDEHQYAWLTRPDSARPLTVKALEQADPAWPEARATALLAWRATHRAPRFLEQRRVVTAELVDLAQRLNDPWKLVMGAEWAAVDAIESGDRATYDRMVAVARWAAAHDGNPRVRWRAAALGCGSAYLDGDVQQARQLIHMARRALGSIVSPCWAGAEMLFKDEELILLDDPVAMLQAVQPDSAAARLNPLEQAGLAYMCARTGDLELARQFFNRSWSALDEEGSMLLHAARLAAAAIELDKRDRIEPLIELLEPFHEHMVVDAHGWWIDGPVAGWLAQLHSALGHSALATDHLARARELAVAVNDVRAIRRLGALDPHKPIRPTIPAPRLPDRELDVLRLMAQGLSNADIAATLSFSVSTIRNSTVAIYRALGVKRRTDAVARAHELGLLGSS